MGVIFTNSDYSNHSFLNCFSLINYLYDGNPYIGNTKKCMKIQFPLLITV